MQTPAQWNDRNYLQFPTEKCEIGRCTSVNSDAVWLSLDTTIDDHFNEIFFRIHSVIESFVREFSDQLSERCLDKVIEICISEMIRANEHTPLIQNPCLETLVAAGRVHCAKVMEGLSKQLNSSQVAHFMVMHCIGSLATANIKGAIPFFRQILETIIPNLGGIKFDHVKQAYSFGEFKWQFCNSHIDEQSVFCSRPH